MLYFCPWSWAAASWAEEEAAEDEQDKFAAHPPVRPGDLRRQQTDTDFGGPAGGATGAWADADPDPDDGSRPRDYIISSRDIASARPGYPTIPNRGGSSNSSR